MTVRVIDGTVMGVLTAEISVIGKVFPTGPVGTANGDPAGRLGTPSQVDGITVQAKTSLVAGTGTTKDAPGASSQMILVAAGDVWASAWPANRATATAARRVSRIGFSSLP